MSDLIERLPRGLDTVLEGGAANISPNLLQAIALARALIGAPSLVLLDQPAAHMDGAGEVALLNAMRKLKAAGVTILIASHKPVVATLADRIMLLKDGVVEVFESRDKVLNAMRRQSLRPVANEGRGRSVVGEAAG